MSESRFRPSQRMNAKVEQQKRVSAKPILRILLGGVHCWPYNPSHDSGKTLRLYPTGAISPLPPGSHHMCLPRNQALSSFLQILENKLYKDKRSLLQYHYWAHQFHKIHSFKFTSFTMFTGYTRTRATYQDLPEHNFFATNIQTLSTFYEVQP